MLSIHQSELDKKRSENFGFNPDRIHIVKSYQGSETNVILIKSYDMSYFAPGGRARLRPIAEYNVYLQTKTHDTIKCFRYSNKAEASKMFTQLKKENK